MTTLGIGSKAAASLALTALSFVTGCADLPADDAQLVTEGVAEAGAAEVAAQRSGELSGANITIDSVSASGAGCPAGSWEAERVPEGNAFTLTFNQYAIEAPATTTAAIHQLPCNISLRIRTPKNLSYAVTSFQYFGYANLTTGMKASLLANYAFTGFGVADVRKEFRHDFPIPYDTTFALNDEITARGVAPTWAPCDITSNLQVRTRLTLETSNRTRPGILAMDNIDVRAQAALKINIRTGPCPAR
ncbi:MAG: DUF4360 domain-containing protein [Polyangiales bacterium]